MLAIKDYKGGVLIISHNKVVVPGEWVVGCGGRETIQVTAKQVCSWCTRRV